MTFKKTAAIVFCVLLISSVAWGDASQPPFKFKSVVRAGDPAPVPPQLSFVFEFAFNDQGQVALVADGGLILKSGSQTTVVAAVGDSAPGGGFFFSVSSPALDPQGQLVFRGNVAFPGISGLYSFSNGVITLLLPDGTKATNGQKVRAGGASFAANGDMLVQDFGGTLFLFSNGTLTRLVGPGDPAPGGGTFTIFSGAAMNQSHQVAFLAFRSTGGTGIYLLSGGTITKIIAAGDIMPDGVPFGFADAPAINDSGQVVFGGVSNSIADTGVFSFSNGQRSLLIPEFTPLPDGSLFETAFTTSLNNAGQVAFIGFNSNFENGVFLFSNGQISELEIPGQVAPDGGTFRIGTEVGATINQSGQVLFLADRLQHGNALYLFSANQLSRVIGQGDSIPRQPAFEFPSTFGIAGGDLVLIADSTFPGNSGVFTATPSHGGNPGQVSAAAHAGEAIGADGIIDFLGIFGMNQGGAVAVEVTSSDARTALLLSSDSSLAVLADSSPSSAVDPGGSSGPAINDNGDIAFTGFAPATQTRGVFLNSNGQTQLVLDAATKLPDGTSLNNITNLALNNDQSLAFMAAPVFPNARLFLFSGGQLTTLATNGSPAPGGGNFRIQFGLSSAGPFIDNRGDVVFASQLTGIPGGNFGSGGVFLFSNGTLSRIVGPNDPSPDGGVFRFANSPSINSQGEVAFFAETSRFTFGVFAARDGQITQVVKAGDVINGQRLGIPQRPELGNDGHIAFTASVGGRNAIFVAANDGNAEGQESTPGDPVSPDEVQWELDKMDLLQMPQPYDHPGQNVRVINPSDQ
jgi:hypothetical protein